MMQTSLAPKPSPLTDAAAGAVPSEGASIHRITSGSRLLGFVAIDSTVAGRARGGLRLVPDLSENELRLAARAMTLKYGLLGLPQGGAKAGVIGNPDAPPDERRRLLHEFASAAERLLRTQTYVPDADLGTTTADIRQMVESIGLPVAPRDWRENRSGLHAARSCLAAARVLAGRLGLRLQDCRVAIEGFGKVGSALALMLRERGARVVAVSTRHGALYQAGGLNVPRLRARSAAAGSRFVDEEPGRLEREALLELPVDLLLPCARLHSIHEGNAARIEARAICAGANNPVTPAAERLLTERGILHLPDFVTNCGGVLGGTLEFAGVPIDRIGRIIDGIVEPMVLHLLDRSAATGATIRAVAEAAALARHQSICAEAERPGLFGRLLGLGLRGYRYGWIPRMMVAPLAERYVVRRVG